MQQVVGEPCERGYDPQVENHLFLLYLKSERIFWSVDASLIGGLFLVLDGVVKHPVSGVMHPWATALVLLLYFRTFVSGIGLCIKHSLGSSFMDFTFLHPQLLFCSCSKEC